jgi:hypothetical protein
MPRPTKPSAAVEGAERTAAVLAGFDYGIHPEDFILYELHRLIEEDRASFDDAEFRRLIDEGIRAHIGESIENRAHLAGMLRSATLQGEAGVIALRVIRALEDVETDLCNVAVIVRNYTGYLVSRLETLEEDSSNDRITTAADLLFESTGDRDAAETALDVLCPAVSPVSARVLAHAVSEPLLDEELEARAFTALKACWPLPRHYLLYNLQEHPHEDIPIRWFQLFADVDEPATAELVLEELRAHGGNPRYQEDLTALMEVLQTCRDPEIEDKILDAVNSPATNPAVLPLLRKFLEEYRPPARVGADPWAQRSLTLRLNRDYLAAAELFDRGERKKAILALDKLLQADPGYPFAVMLKRLAGSAG